MKFNYAFFLLFLLCNPLLAQQAGPPLIWVNPIQSASDSPDNLGMEVLDLAVSPEGSTYMVGICTFPCAFAQGVSVVPEAGGQSLFIAKYRYDGLFEWVKDLGTIGSTPAHIAAPSLDGVYLATSFTTDQVDLGNGISVSRNCTGSGCADGLVAKFGPSGEAIWAKTIEGDAATYFQIAGIEQNNTGSVTALVNYNSESIDLGPGLTFNNLSAPGFCLIMMHAETGAFTSCIFPMSSTNEVFSKSLAYNQQSVGAVSGTFYDQITFSNGVTLNSTNPNGDQFIAGLNPFGAVQWVYKLGSNDYTDILAVEVDALGSAYLAIDASQDLLLNNNTILSINTSYAGAVLKLDANGFSIPVFIPYNTDDFAVMDVEVDQWGIIYTVGYTSGSIQFGNDLVDVDGCSDALLTQTNADGIPIGARTIGGGGCEAITNFFYGSCMELDAFGFLYGAGGFLFNFNEDGFSFNGRGGFVTKINTSIVSVNEPEFAALLEIYPNPTTGIFTLKLPEPPSADAFISITNTQGQEVLHQTANQQEINMETLLSPGMYLVSVMDGSRIYRGKILVR